MTEYHTQRKYEKSNDILELNVGGMTDGFTVKRSLLCKVPGSSLEAMFSPRNEQLLQKINGKIFVDRDPRIFKYVISYLKNDCFLNSFKSFYEKELFEKEIDFWGLRQNNEITIQNHDIIELNVSGKTDGFAVSRMVLCSVPGSKLAKLFKNTSDLLRINDRIFLDRDPEIFTLVIQYLKSNFMPPDFKSA